MMARGPYSRRGFLKLSGALLAGAGIEAAHAADPYRAVTVNLARHDISLHWLDGDGEPYRKLRRVRRMLRRQDKRVLALTNAGIYGRDFKPLGLHIENGEMLRPLNEANGGGNFFLKPNGVFFMTPNGAQVVAAERFAMRDDIVLATQSGPLLFDERGFHPRFLEHSTSRYIRNGVGVRDDGNVVLAISRREVTFWDFATMMRDDLGCAAALYLDGNLSQLWRHEEIMSPAWQPFVGILAVTAR